MLKKIQFHLLLQKKNIVIGKKELDITNHIIKIFNSIKNQLINKIKL